MKSVPLIVYLRKEGRLLTPGVKSSGSTVAAEYLVMHTGLARDGLKYETNETYLI